ncbi:hypothetical protein K431DRAFT_271056 [Polychaeton citri CBS 116435]|uniref:Amino acid transporter transmembrane domain-containing protein n=1 Tax=Polychaeton citri CBS 116435 TaxID=1314669 RepID=A0A9P4Q8G6_9PEZI|nr:hypothetical protein K431DRAFT_271056 [Polychaeton citri CBS 116435]
MADSRRTSLSPSPGPVRGECSTSNSDVVPSSSPSRAAATVRLGTPIPDSPISSAQNPTPREAQPQDILESQTPLAGPAGSSTQGPGSSSLSQALRGSFGQTPPRHGTPPPNIAESLAAYDRGGGGGSFTPSSYNAQLGRSPRAAEDIEVLKRHLVQQPNSSEPGSYRRGSGPLGSRADAQQAAVSGIGDDEFSSLQLQGGDTTRHIYRYAEKKEREQAEQEGRGPGRIKRSFSASVPNPRDPDEESIQNIQVPGGFRRDHIRRTAGSPAPSSSRISRPDYGSVQRAFTEPARLQPRFVTSNFIEFLTLYGHFAGEELEEDDEALGPDEYFSSDAYDDDTATDAENDDRSAGSGGWGEDSALLTPGKRRRRRRQREAGKGTPFGAALLLLKSFVGTGVLFLPRAFLNGGMLFSNLVLFFIAALSYYCFILLCTTRLKVRASFGDMGGIIYGKHFRNLINFSLVISQIGFASAYIVFVSENLQAFVLAVSKCKEYISIVWMILLQMVIFLPLSLYRNINNIQKLALVADLFILLGLIYLYFYDIKTIVEQKGVSDIVNFNRNDWTLFIGTAIFTFEGIGLIIPIQSSMAQPKKFPRVLGIVMVAITIVFISMGALSYAAYGSKTKTVIILNLPQDNRMVNGVQFIYSLAILLSTPLQIYPAIEITSQQLFSRTGKYNPWVKWKKNIFRFFMVVLCAVIAWAGANDLDKFVAVVGSFACVPLVYIYPPMMHYRVATEKTWQRVADIALVVFGFVVMGYTTALTVISWFHGTTSKPPGYCDER